MSAYNGILKIAILKCYPVVFLKIYINYLKARFLSKQNWIDGDHAVGRFDNRQLAARSPPIRFCLLGIHKDYIILAAITKGSIKVSKTFSCVQQTAFFIKNNLYDNNEHFINYTLFLQEFNQIFC